MKLLVTGGAGFIGSAVVRLAVERGHEVINLDALTYAACLDNVAPVARSPNYTFVQADIRDALAIQTAINGHKPDAIMHLAAESPVDRSIDGPGDFIETNVNGTYVMLEAARAYWEAQGRPDTFRFHHVSTDEVYGTLGATGMFTEETPYAPNSPYSASKAASDHLVRAWGETYGLPVVITNCSNNYGPYHFPEKLIPLIISRALNDQSLPVYGDGLNVRDWLYVEDHCSAIAMILEGGCVGEVYNVGGYNEKTNLDVVKTILDELEKPHSLIEFVKDRAGHDLRYAIDPTKIETELGWSPQTPFAEGIKKTIQWYLNNEKWWKDILSGDYRKYYETMYGERGEALE